jgi:hypothetical protein
MSFVKDVFAGWTRKKQAEEAARELTKQIALEVFVQAAATDRPLSDTEAEQFIDMLERERLTEAEFESAVSARRELIAAREEVEACRVAAADYRKLAAEHQAELDSRKAEDLRREQVDTKFAIMSTRLRELSSKIADARSRLKSALPQKFDRTNSGGWITDDGEVDTRDETIAILTQRVFEQECQLLLSSAPVLETLCPIMNSDEKPYWHREKQRLFNRATDQRNAMAEHLETLKKRLAELTMQA